MKTCKLCNTNIKGKYVRNDKQDWNLCDACIKTCGAILKDYREQPYQVTYLNEYKDRKGI